MTLIASVNAGVALADAHRSQATTAPAGVRMIPGQYLITLDPGMSPQTVLDRLGVKPIFTYGSVFTGFSARLTSLQVAVLRKLPGFRDIEPDAEVKTMDLRSAPTAVGAWGLDRIGQRSLPLDGTYSPKYDGATVTAYILDTGIEYTHKEFGGRVTFGFDAVGDGRRGMDCHGHGTHVAGTVGGATYGVAKKVKLVSVRVLDCHGDGEWSGILAGLD